MAPEYAVLAVVLGLILAASGGLQLWAAFRRGTFYGAGGVKYHESPTKNPVHFWARVILTAGSVAFAGWLVIKGIAAIV